MMEIKILGPGCAKCKRLELLVRKVADRQGWDVKIEKVEEMAKILAWPILSTPGLVINGKLLSAGRLPNEAELTTWLKP